MTSAPARNHTTAQVVVINLGTNDFNPDKPSGAGSVSSEEYAAAYVDLLATVRQRM
jgi:lysophospholipase L1-like esterase